MLLLRQIKIFLKRFAEKGISYLCNTFPTLKDLYVYSEKRGIHKGPWSWGGRWGQVGKQVCNVQEPDHSLRKPPNLSQAKKAYLDTVLTLGAKGEGQLLK